MISSFSSTNLPTKVPIMSIKHCLALTNTADKKKEQILQAVIIHQGKDFLISALNSKLNSSNQPTNQPTKE